MLACFASGFKSFMKRKKINAKQIAESLGVSESAVNGWKYGRSFPDVPNLFRLVEMGLAFVEILPSAIGFLNRVNTDDWFTAELERKTENAINDLEKELDPVKSEELQKRISENKERIYRIMHEHEHIRIKEAIERQRKLRLNKSK